MKTYSNNEDCLVGTGKISDKSVDRVLTSPSYLVNYKTGYRINKNHDFCSAIFDGFIGSGTTAIACLNTNRNFIGFELDTKYFDIANKRIRRYKMKNKKTGVSETEEIMINGGAKIKKGINPVLFDNEPAYVSFRLGETKNLGNFNSCKIEVSITRPCKNTKKVIDKTFNKLIEDVRNKLSKETVKIKQKSLAEDTNGVELEFLDE